MNVSVGMGVYIVSDIGMGLKTGLSLRYRSTGKTVLGESVVTKYKLTDK